MRAHGVTLPARPAASRLSPALALWLALALLLAQFQGQLHRVVHGPGVLHGHVAGAGVHSPDHATPGVHWLAPFEDHEGESDCRLYDQGGHPALVAALPALVLPAFLTPPHRGVFAAPAPAWRCALIQARGPPPAR